MARNLDKSTKNYSTFSPRYISDCIFWIDASDNSSITYSTSPTISGVRDKSNSNKSISVIGSVTYNSNNTSFEFTSTDGRFNVSGASLPENTYDCLFVCTINPNRDIYRALLRANITPSPGIDIFVSNISTDNIGAWTGASTSVNFSQFGSITQLPNTKALYYVTVNASKQIQASQNGTIALTTATVASTNSGQIITIGNDYAGGQGFGYLHELMIFSRTMSTTERQQVEGYLAWKWGLSTSLPVGHPYVSTVKHGPVLSYFKPTDISGCGIWLDAADKSTITGTTQVTNWTNKGNIAGMSAINNTGSCSSGNTYNGLNYINCPAGADLKFICTLSVYPRTWFVVSRCKTQLTYTTSTVNYWGPVSQVGGGGRDSPITYFKSSSTNYSVGESAAGTATKILSATVPDPYNSIIIYSGVNGTNTSENYIGINGSSYVLTISSAANSDYFTGSATYNINNAGYNTGSDIFEILYFSRALTSNERQNIEGYLAWKWGLRSTLPSTHTFKNIYPLKIN